ncbi:uri1, prefoldin-like chaperone [Apophysomyces ossiformis]|uniref:Uri1, prefoldin-like chaperone n=1 Tax=Apophysomyces ossiformis TaxID=679940 RepID=A0A8H7BKI0_9FUNG|nr:uri1, prefoldin-like chaperone [Apophysomyces ossiformis]
MDLLGQLDRLTSHIGQNLEYLETELERWQTYKRDNDALKKQLKTLPDTTAKTAMIPIGKLAFMPGRLIHTNEILVLLGDNYYAERSAKQAIGIVERRDELVKENLALIEAQLNAAKTKSDASNVLQQSGQTNEEGLPIMEIREELPSSPSTTAKKQVLKEELRGELPASVQRARDMMKSKPVKTDENKALFDMLQQLEEEEEEVGEEEIEQKEDKHEEEEEDADQEWDELYDTEVTDTMFDHFEDDEEYAADGVVEQEDATYHDEPEEKNEDHISKDRGLPDVVEPQENLSMETARKDHSVKTSVKDVVVETKEESITVEPTIKSERKPKKVSRFKLARQEERVSEENVSSNIASSAIPAVIERDNPSAPIHPPEKPKSVHDRSVPTVLSSDVLKSRQKLPSGLAKDGSAPVKEKKKMSKFKQSRQQEKPSQRKVTWDDTTTVREHDRLSAPITTSAPLYSEPLKEEPEEKSLPAVRTPADIFSLMRGNQNAEIEYPSLDDDDDTPKDSKSVDIQELVSAAKKMPETFWRPVDGSDEEAIQQVQEMRSTEPAIRGPPSLVKSKMDTNIMKGQVIERETENLDLDQVEDDMDMREIAAKYHSKRQELVAAMEGFQYEPKPEFEVIDEELPLPKQQKGKKEEQVEEEPQPRKVSRFKAARLGLRPSHGIE